ncbi:uncharacterized protein LY89DRAFT_675531 [Mollisia scopiformis]|uniref:Uncharacterized protein n=1 Tax=Mollisia scopiformis TaxID=149040 RepID=A0A132BCQ1_MOLSC|nr:uncharacterized protein LY89DRAFT_675531 [Mollisia scopiformis]KUJ10033.1 hypothetical protein LY89DRAFT_675531 [Mollisia scopiformis]
MHSALLLLQEYAKSFNRHMPRDIQALVLKNQDHFDYLFFVLDRASILDKVTAAVKFNNLHNFKSLFRTAVDHLNDQLLEIRYARKALFTCEVDNDSAVDMHPADPASVDHIDWNTREPEMGPFCGQNIDDTNSSDENSDGGNQGTNGDSEGGEQDKDVTEEGNITALSQSEEELTDEQDDLESTLGELGDGFGLADESTGGRLVDLV